MLMKITMTTKMLSTSDLLEASNQNLSPQVLQKVFKEVLEVLEGVLKEILVEVLQEILQEVL